jgi:hypothetical protein
MRSNAPKAAESPASHSFEATPTGVTLVAGDVVSGVDVVPATDDVAMAGDVAVGDGTFVACVRPEPLPHAVTTTLVITTSNFLIDWAACPQS